MTSIDVDMELNIDKTNWTAVCLVDVVQETREVVRDPVKEGIEKVLGLEHIDSESIHLRRWETLEQSTTFTKKFVKGQVLFGRRRAYLKKAALAPFDGICSGDITVLEAKEDLLPELLPFLINNERFFDFAIKNSAGSLSPRAKFKDLANYEFLLPPKDEQARLAELLWAADAVVERQRTLVEAALNTFSAFSNKYFNKDVDKSISLGECAEVIMGQSPPGESYNQDGIGEPLINGPTEFTERYPVKIQWTSQPSKLCEDGDILLCVRGSTTGRMNIANDKYCIGRGVAAIRGRGKVTTDFLEFALRYNVDEIMRVATGSTFPNIDSQTLKKIRIPNVSAEKQVEIIVKLKELDSIQRELSSVIELSKQLQKSLINQIF